jgi:plastocyanin
VHTCGFERMTGTLEPAFRHREEFMRKHRWLRYVVCAALAVTVAASSFSCSSKSGGGGNPVSPAPKELDSGNIAPTGSYSHTFNTAGTFNYHCNVHPGLMPGTVNVTAGAPVDDNVSITGTVAFPTKNIHVGAKITWTNNSAMNHTVTSD